MADLLSMLQAASGSGGEPDPYFNQTTLLLHGDGTNGAQNNTFLDSSTNNFTITKSGNTTQGTFSPFSLPNGRWSNYFVDNTDYLSATVTAPGTGDFTVEAWVWFATLSGNQIIFSFGNYNPAVYYRSASSELAVYHSSAFYLSGFTPEVNTWYHIAFTRSGTDSRLFVNGVQQGATTTYSTNITSTTFRMGYDSVDYFGGYLSNVRYVNGTALYTSSFTPSTSPLTAISGTELLTCQSNRFVDNSTNASTITPTGAPSVQPFSPFAPTAAYDPAVNGGGSYFDGTGDYLTVASDAAFGYGTGDFTIEFFIYFKSLTAGVQPILFDQRTTATQAVPTIYYNNALLYYVSAGNRITGGALKINTWYHIAVCRSGTSTKMFVDGVQVGSTYTDSTNYVTSQVSIGTYQPSPANYYTNAYYSDVRIVKGTALYTTAFTPPTAPLTAVSGTELLCNFTNAGIFDNTGKNNLDTVGDAQIDTTTKKYGTGSMKFDGNDAIRIDQPTLFDFGTGDYTIELWANATTTGDFVFWWGRYNFSENAFGIRLQSSYWQIGINTSGTSISYYGSGGATVNTGQWYHLALTRSSGTAYLWVDGVQRGSVSQTANLNTAYGVYIGAANSTTSWTAGLAQFDGFIDDVRITNGVARYTTTFTPPDAPFQDQ